MCNPYRLPTRPPYIMNKDRLKLFLFAGVEYNLIDYKDSQTTPNHVRADMGPLGTLGVEMKF